MSSPGSPSEEGLTAGKAELSAEAEALFSQVAAELRPRVPGATYRVQLNAGFTFQQASEVLPYLRQLGISDLYASPFFKARPGSAHGYDIVDHNALSEEIGGETAFDAYCETLRREGLGQLLDFVPNHMGIGVRGNAWWMDVLENGPSSVFASFFDIDWQPLKSELAGKVLLPILGDHYGRVLENGDLKLAYEGGAFFLHYWETPLPVNPRTYSRVLERLLDPVARALGAESEPLLELQSILTGLKHLPHRTESTRAKVLERRREKEILKRRIAALVDQTPAVAMALQQAVSDLNGQVGQPRSFDALHELLESQAYRLSFWRVAAEEVNYRRFFEINDLAAIRMENTAVFDIAHRRLFHMLGSGCVTGLRIDHPDGLWDPTGYFTALQRGYFLERCRRRWVETAPERSDDFDRLCPRLITLYERQTDPLARPLYVVVEKILSRGEQLPTEWMVHGTSGYEFTNLVAGLFVDTSGEADLTDTYERFIGGHVDFNELVYRKKKLVLQTALASELNVLSAVLNRLSERDRHSRDFTLGSLTDALREVIACFPVYRTYTTERSQTVTEHDRVAIARAIRLARFRNPTTDASVFAFIRANLMLEVPSSVADPDRHLWREFVMRFQQLTGPVMAKGLEDTAFYIYNRLVSLNEVGGEPERFGVSVDTFHQANLRRQREWPHSMLATSTHDTKRSEDVRARISVLSELTDTWREALAEIRALSQPLKAEIDERLAPDPNEEYLFYETLLGVWPQGPQEGAFDDAFVARLVAYMRKATKEAKENTSWVDASPDYDAAVESFVRNVLRPDSAVRRRLDPLAKQVAWFGRWGAVSQTLLKLMSPGVPDIYQGNETWDFSLVDPDNRRPIDYALRQQMLRDLTERAGDRRRLAGELIAAPEDGRLKLYATHVALLARQRHPERFGAQSEYRVLNAEGARAEHLVAFSRRHGTSQIVLVVPRLVAKLTQGKEIAPVAGIWAETRLPEISGRFRNLLTDETIDARGSIDVSSLLSVFPWAILESTGDT